MRVLSSADLTHPVGCKYVALGIDQMKEEICKYADPTSKWYNPNAPGLPREFWGRYHYFARPLTGIANRQRFFGTKRGDGLHAWVAQCYDNGVVTPLLWDQYHITLADGVGLQLPYQLKYYLWYREVVLRWTRVPFNREWRTRMLERDARYYGYKIEDMLAIEKE